MESGAEPSVPSMLHISDAVATAGTANSVGSTLVTSLGNAHKFFDSQVSNFHFLRKLAFGVSPSYAFGLHTGEIFSVPMKQVPGFDQMNKFTTPADCVAYYDAAIARLGACGDPNGRMGGSMSAWKRRGCSKKMGINGGPAPCCGSVDTSTSLPQAFNLRSESSHSLLHFDTEHVAITIKGKSINASDCEMEFYYRMTTHSTGLQTSSHSINKSPPSDPKCSEWFLMAEAMATSFFNLWRLDWILTTWI